VDEAKVPVELARLWRLPAESRLGRPAKLDVDQVVRTAVRLADRDGLAGATLPKVAEALDVTKMSLYRHVGAKDELLTLMYDEASGPPPDISVAPGQWRAGLWQWSLALVARHREHPWLAQVPVAGPPAGPHQIGWMEAAFRAIRDTGLDWATKLSIITVVSGFIRGNSQLNQEMAAGRDQTGLDQLETERHYGRALAALVDPKRFPEAAELFRSGLFEESPVPVPEGAEDLVDHDFVTGLELILDGVAAAITAAGAAQR
jgi:AcrR family transcriptional regulator